MLPQDVADPGGLLGQRRAVLASGVCAAHNAQPLRRKWRPEDFGSRTTAAGPTAKIQDGLH